MMILLRRIAILLLVLVGVVSSGPGADGDYGAPTTSMVSLVTATIKYSNGDSYVGNVDGNGLKSGHGIFEWANGDVYDGDWLDDKRHGKGKLTLANGNVYDGEFKNDLMNGLGTWTRILLRYQGEWSNDKKHGKGAESWFGNLIEFKGEWERDWLTSTEHTRVGIDVAALLNMLVAGYIHVLAVRMIMWGFQHIRDLKGTKSNKEATGGVGVVHVERDGTDDTDLVVRLDSDYSHCSICYQAFTTDMERTDQTSRELLPVLGLCGHYFCHGCIIGCKYMVRRSGVGCPKCSKADQFVPGSPLYHRMLIDLLHRARPIGTVTACIR